MMNKVNQINELAVDRAMKSMGYATPNDAAHYMWGFYRGLLNHLERSVPGVAKELETEIFRLRGGGL
jgi:hypothetical protein